MDTEGLPCRRGQFVKNLLWTRTTAEGPAPKLKQTRAGRGALFNPTWHLSALRIYFCSAELPARSQFRPPARVLAHELCVDGLFETSGCACPRHTSGRF